MSVIGIDFGNEACYVAAAKAGGIETLTNDYSLRATPSCVAFDGKKRIIGVAAKNQQVTNMKNTVSGFKRLLGRKFNDSHVQRELNGIPNKVEKRPDGSIGIRVNYLDQEQFFSPEQLTAMLFTKLKETSAHALMAQVNDCVITCPVYFTDAERKALLDAAHIAGLNVLRLMNETTATALSYGFYKQDLPDDKPRNVIFVDCGNSSLQVSACAFTKGRLRMIASTWDQLGGRDFDTVLADYFAKEFYERYKINAKSNARAYLRLLTEVEKVKKQMSANSTKLPLNIECFMDDIDVSSSIQRVQMEEMCAPLFQRVEMTFVRLLSSAGLSLDDIHSVEIVGGSSRIPAIKNLIEQVFGKPASTTLNQDESVARGAALQCAIMSPAVRVREFSVTDIQNYAVKVSWDGEGGSDGGEIEVFPAFHSAPFSRMLTLNRKEPFTMTLQYNQAIPYPDPVIGKWYIRDVKPNERGEQQEVKVKVRINNHGIVLISSASLVDRKEQDEQAQQQQQQPQQSPQQQQQPHHHHHHHHHHQQQSHHQGADQGNNDEMNDHQQHQAGGNHSGESNEVAHEACNDNEDDNNATTASSPGGQGWAQRVKGWFSSGGEKKKKSSKLIELPMDVKTHGFPSSDLTNYQQQEARMIANDAKETQRVDARNALEEFVYDMRNKLQGGPLESFVVPNERDEICQQLNDIEYWLYEDGENCDREVYVQKLKSLQKRTDAIKERANDYEQCPSAFAELQHTINTARRAVDEYRGGAPKYDHLTETEFINISEAADKAHKWLDSHYNKFSQSPRTSDSPVKLSDIRHEIQTLYTCVSTVVNRPKPKPAPKTKDGGNNSNASGASSNAADQQNGENADRTAADDKSDKMNSHNMPEDTTMEVE